MALTAGQTRLQIRQAVGRHLGGARFFVSTTTSSACDTTSVLDTGVIIGNDEKNSWWVRSNEGTNLGQTRKVSNSVNGDLTTAAFGANVPNSMDYELWPPEFNPDNADNAIDCSIIASYGKGMAHLENESLHTGGCQTRFSLPSAFSYMQRIMRRTSVRSLRVHDTTQLFDESVDSDITQTIDTENQRTGAGILKLVVAAGASAGDFISDSFSATDFSWGSHLEFWAKSDVTIAAGAITILLDDTAAVASPLETLSVPALVADVWTFCRVALTAREALTALISIGIKFDTDTGAQTVYIGPFDIVDENSAIWETYHRDAWRVDKANRGVLFYKRPGYGLLRLIGGQEPQKLAADTCVVVLDDEYIIAKTTALMFAQSHLERYKDATVQWEARAQAAYRGVPRPAYVRYLS